MLEFLFMGLRRQQCPHRLPQKFLLSCQNGCLSETTTSQDCRNVNKIGGDKPTISFLLYILFPLYICTVCKISLNFNYRVFQLDMLHFKRLLGHQKCTFKSWKRYLYIHEIRTFKYFWPEWWNIKWNSAIIQDWGCGGQGCYFQPNPRVISQISASHECTDPVFMT